MAVNSRILASVGSGIRRICEAFLENGNKIPVFENFQHGFSVTVFPRTAQKAGQKTGLETGQKTGKKNIDEEILSHLRTNPNLTIVELCSLLGKGKSMVNEYIRRLKKLGKLQRQGSDKKGLWVVIDN